MRAGRWLSGIAAGATLASLAAAACFGAPAAAASSPAYLSPTDPLLNGVTLERPRERPPRILERVRVRGSVAVPAPGQTVEVAVRREGKLIATREVPADPVSGRYRATVRLKGCCSYVVQARHRGEASDPLLLRVRAPATLEPGRLTLLFNRLLRRNGYHMGEDPLTGELDERTALGIMALRKVHDLARTESYDAALFELLLGGDARFEPVNREPGRHVEVDVSRQVMALVEDGEATDVVHVSTGAGGTPSGEWSFYDKAPGYNAKGMYYSAYYDGNYATHGYASVPTYPASHGCTRNPIPYAVYIYDWIEIGMPIHVYA